MTREKAIDKVAPMLSHIDKMTAGKKIKWMKGLVHQFYDDFEQELAIAVSDKSCDGCKYKSLPKEIWCDICTACARFYSDNYEEKK